MTDSKSPPYLTAELPGIGGVIKQQADDFVVEEIPSYQPCGTGEHLFLWIEKKNTSSDHLVRHIARSLDISNRDISTAGLKDRWAVTRQFVCVPARAIDRVDAINTDLVRVLHSQQHTNKLRTGHCRGNAFSILVRETHVDAEQQVELIKCEIDRLGFPNYYGSQRFGFQGETAQMGIELLAGRMQSSEIPRSKRRFLLRLSLSAAQSMVFNDILTNRITNNQLHAVEVGDVMQVVSSGGPFVVEDVEREQARFDAHEIVLTGPMFGRKMKQPTDGSLKRELASLEKFELQVSDFDRYPKLTSGTRRPLIIWPPDLRVEMTDGGVRFDFTLPTGAYATSLLREFQKNDAGTEL